MPWPCLCSLLLLTGMVFMLLLPSVNAHAQAPFNHKDSLAGKLSFPSNLVDTSKEFLDTIIDGIKKRLPFSSTGSHDLHLKGNKDSLMTARISSHSFRDTSKKLIDTGITKLKSGLNGKEKEMRDHLLLKKKNITNLFSKNPSLNTDTVLKQFAINPYQNLFHLAPPLLHLDGGFISYGFNYRSSTDTPYAEKNIAQHMVNGSINFSVEKILPFTANFWVQRSNSRFFRNITDVQIVFNAAAFRGQLTNSVKQKFSSAAAGMQDSALGKLYALKKLQTLNLKNWLQNPFQFQKLIEANETIRVPRKSYDPSLPDSLNLKRTDSLQSTARAFIKNYQAQKELYEKLFHEKDSLGQAYQKLTAQLQRYRSLMNGGGQNSFELRRLEDSLKEYGMSTTPIPAKLKWLMGVRNFALGKTPVNYSELTARNISLTGINMEYNSWYYLAFCAGLIDYRFNDMVVNRSTRVNQYMYMVRAGLGKVENSHFILSVYRGRKQLFTAADSSGALATIPVLGVSAETQIRLNPYTYAVAEVAESLSPDYHTVPSTTKTKFDFVDKTNKALSVKLYAYVPVLGTRLEGMYKYTGSNFQSFSSFQTNSALKTWYIKAEQYFWNRKLKLTGSLRTNDFTNPYITQNYNSNIVFKSISASFRTRHFPTIMVGYMPMSQLTAIGNQIVENRFQTLTANINHYYKIGSIRSSTVAVLTKFYNGSSDTSFVFYNATNMLIEQSLFFKDFTASVNFSRSRSLRYELNVVGEEINFPFSKRGSLGIGLKLNNFNKTENKIGELFNFNYQIGRMDYISLAIERGYLPGTSGNLIHNDFGNIQFVKRF